MSAQIATILELINKAGLGDIVNKFMERSNDVDKLKLKFISILVDKMDDKGMCDIREIIKELVEKEKLIDFDND